MPIKGTPRVILNANVLCYTEDIIIIIQWLSLGIEKSPGSHEFSCFLIIAIDLTPLIKIVFCSTEVAKMPAHLS